MLEWSIAIVAMEKRTTRMNSRASPQPSDRDEYPLPVKLIPICVALRCYAHNLGQGDLVRSSRREILRRGAAAATFLVALPSSSSARKIYTNLEEAREAGEARREEKERALGPIITLPSGIRFRELDAVPGDVVSVHYVIYRLNGMYLDSLGYGNEGKDDVGDVLTFQIGQNTVPRAVELGMEGMKLGGRRRILVSPELGWTEDSQLPRPTTAAAGRRLLNSVKKPLLFELELVKINRRNSGHPS